MKKLLFVFGFIFIFFSMTNAQSYRFHNSSGNVSFYYKVDDYGVWFKVVNDNDFNIKVKICDAHGEWYDNDDGSALGSFYSGKTITKDFTFTVLAHDKDYVRLENTDSFSKLKKWSFSCWKWWEL